MDLSVHLLGSRVVSQIRDRLRAPVLVIGVDRFSRDELASVHCYHYFAALYLTRALAGLEVTSTKDVYNRIPPSALVLPHVGAYALAVLGAAFELKRLGGDSPLDNWSTKHRDPALQKREWITFASLKTQSRDARASRRERRAAKARKHSRRDQAHRLRVDRFERQSASH
jgi:hypothetical protein